MREILLVVLRVVRRRTKNQGRWRRRRNKKRGKKIKYNHSINETQNNHNLLKAELQFVNNKLGSCHNNNQFVAADEKVPAPPLVYPKRGESLRVNKAKRKKNIKKEDSGTARRPIIDHHSFLRSSNETKPPTSLHALLFCNTLHFDIYPYIPIASLSSFEVNQSGGVASAR